MFHYLVDEHLRKIEGVSEVKFTLIKSLGETLHHST